MKPGRKVRSRKPKPWEPLPLITVTMAAQLSDGVEVTLQTSVDLDVLREKLSTMRAGDKLHLVPVK